MEGTESSWLSEKSIDSPFEVKRENRRESLTRAIKRIMFSLKLLRRDGPMTLKVGSDLCLLLFR